MANRTSLTYVSALPYMTKPLTPEAAPPTPLPPQKWPLNSTHTYFRFPKRLQPSGSQC